MEQIRPELHLLWGKATQAAWHTEHPQRRDTEAQNQSFDGLGEAGTQRKRNQEPVAVWALDRAKTI
jgi:hypothetical protein